MMFHSSIFSSDTLVENPIRLLLRPTILMVLLVLLLLELGVRMFIPEGHTPRGGYHNSELRQKVNQLKQLKQVDLMFTGSSVAAVNYAPDTFDKQLRGYGFAGFTSFNAGIRGCDFSCIGPGTTKLFLALKQPRYLVIIMGPNDFDENPYVIARSKKFVDSFNQLNYRVRLRNVLSSVSWLFGFDAEIRALLASGEWPFDPHTHLTTRGRIDMGFAPRKKILRDYKIDSGGNIAKAFYGLVSNATQRGISVILVPVFGSSKDRAHFGPAARQGFAAVIAAVSANDLVSVVRAREDAMSDEDYIDPTHLNTDAAHKNTIDLARLITEGNLVKTK